MADPTYVTRDQMRAAYDALLLDPDELHHTRLVRIEPDRVYVERYRYDGNRIVAVDGDFAVATVEIPLRTAPPDPDRAQGA